MRIRPQVLVDLKKSDTGSIFSKKNLRLNLRETKIIRIPIFKFFKIGALLLACSYLVFGSVLAPVDRAQMSMAAQSDEERKQLEDQLKVLESQIDQYQGTIDQYSSQGKSLEGEIKTLNARIAKLNLQVKSTTLSLKKLDAEITDNKTQIKATESNIEKNKRVLSEILQGLYSSGNTNLAEVFLKNLDLSDFFDDIKDLIDVQDNLRITLEKVSSLKQELEDEQEQLAIKRSDVDSLKNYQLSQKQAVDSAKKDKGGLLKTTKGQESKYQELLKETQKTAAEIRSQIFKLLGGGELPFGDAVKIAQLAEKATGIRAAFILAVLTQESAIKGVIGANVGQCYLKNPQTGAGVAIRTGNSISKVMNPTRDVPVFIEITKEFKMDPYNTSISCPFSFGWGGAMGPAQFIPSTWNIYKDKVSKITGNNPPNPWNNSDAFVATALYLKDNYNSNSCIKYANDNSNVSSRQKLQERCAAAKYYAGGNWYIHRWDYGDPVAERADDFAEEIDILNAN